MPRLIILRMEKHKKLLDSAWEKFLYATDRAWDAEPNRDKARETLETAWAFAAVDFCLARRDRKKPQQSYDELAEKYAREKDKILIRQKARQKELERCQKVKKKSLWLYLN